MPKVVIVQRILPHYRVPFFAQLHEYLAKRGIQLVLVYGQEKAGEVPETHTQEWPWAICVRNRYLNIFGQEFVYQPIKFAWLKNADAVIVEQANRLLVNYFLLFMKLWRPVRIGFWGHGRDFSQSAERKPFSGRMRALLSRMPDFWLAYTRKSQSALLEIGVSREKISVVNNCIDIEPFKQKLALYTPEQIAAEKARIGLQQRSVLLFCGGMVERKKIPFLLDSLRLVYARDNNIGVVFIGSGPHQPMVADFCSENRWAVSVGEVTSSDRAIYFSMSELLVMPGVLGLVVVDSLVAQTPIVTIDSEHHNPEIAYLENGENAVFTNADTETYAEAVLNLLNNPSELKRLKQNCSRAAEDIGLDKMVGYFGDALEAEVTRNDT